MKRLCTNCKGENEYIISETSSSYVYCEDCGNMKEIALKQDIFDSILKSMDTYFKHTVDYLIEDDLHISSSEIELHIEFIN